MTVTFGSALKDFFTRYATFSGRSTRAQFWYVVLAMTLFGMIVTFPLTFFTIVTGGTGAVLYVFVGIFEILIIVPSLALGVRRLHDIDRSGWWMLLFYLVPLFSSIMIALAFATPHDPNIFILVMSLILYPVAGIWALVWMCTPGTEGPNEYGPDLRELPDAQPQMPVAPYGAPQWQQPYNQQPYNQNPYGQNPYQGNPYSQNPYQGNPYGQNPYQGNPYRGNPYGQNEDSQNQNPYNNR